MGQSNPVDVMQQVPERLQSTEPPAPEEAVDLIVDKFEAWIETGIQLLPNFGVAILTILVAWVVSRIVRKLLDSTLDRTPVPGALQSLIVTATGVGILALGLFVALGVLGLDKTVLSLLAGVGILGLALGFAFQDIAANFIAGILLSIRRPIHVGDVIETNDFFGTVREINLRSTIIEKPEGQNVVIPNKQVFENPMTNYSKRGRRRIDLPVGVSYGDDLEQAREIAIQAVESLQIHEPSLDIELFYEEFGNSSINFVLRFWIGFERQEQYMQARSQAIMAIRAAFDARGITIPFPIRTLDFGSVVDPKLLSD